MRMPNINGYYRFLSVVILLFSCVPTVFSPHAPNEMVAPYNRTGEVHELGAAFALNHWIVDQHEDTVYLRTYPSASFSLFHNAYLAKGAVGGIGGIEFIGFPTTWWVPSGEGFALVFRPYLGFQYASTNFALRASLAPLTSVISIAGGELEYGGGLNLFTFYLVDIFLHNGEPSKHIYWIGVRNSPAALGGLGGYQYALSEKHMFRTECSLLTKPPFSLTLSREDLNSIRGYVLYLTAGVFVRLK
jgi:hypothetical protein